MLLTGGLHLDGLADSADAWAGGLGERERSLEIMKDPRSGALAIVILILVMLVKFAALHALLTKNSLLIVIVPVMARAAIPLLFITTDYVRENGLGSDMVNHLPRKGVYVSVVLSLCLVFVLADFSVVLWLIAVAVLVFYFLRQLMIDRIGGTTGDTAGALIEILEAILLTTLVLQQ